MIRFDAKYLPMLALFMAKDDVRYYLNGFHVQPAPETLGGVFLIATDGHILIAIHDKAGTADRPITVTLDRAALRHVRRRGMSKACEINPDTGRLRVLIAGQDGIAHPEGAAAELFVQAGDALIRNATYPDWKKVFPDFSSLKPASPAWLQSRLLETICKAARLAGLSKDVSSMRLWSNGESQSIVVAQFGLVREMVAVIMPMYGEDDQLSEVIGSVTAKTTQGDAPMLKVA